MNAGQLSVEEEYRIALFTYQVQQMSERDAKDALGRYYEMWVRRGEEIKRGVGTAWGLIDEITPPQQDDESFNEWG